LEELDTLFPLYMKTHQFPFQWHNYDAFVTGSLGFNRLNFTKIHHLLFLFLS
jgi:hypothetical protein